MDWSFLFLFNSILLGIGLAMDAFSVSLANGLCFPDLRRSKIFFSSLLFGFFQGLMPLLGWFCVHMMVEKLSFFSSLVPYIALVLLLYIGIGMIRNAGKDEGDSCMRVLSLKTLLLQALATSIDALSVGFTISEYSFVMALASVSIIAFVTFVICLLGVYLGRKAGCRYAKASAYFGGVIIILIGLEIFITGLV